MKYLLTLPISNTVNWKVYYYNSQIIIEEYEMDYDDGKFYLCHNKFYFSLEEVKNIIIGLGRVLKLLPLI